MLLQSTLFPHALAGAFLTLYVCQSQCFHRMQTLSEPVHEDPFSITEYEL